MARDAVPQTPRRSRRFQPLATPFIKNSAPAGFECTWDGEPICTRPCNPELDLMQEDLDAREDGDEDDGKERGPEQEKEETVFYASFTVKKPRPKQYRGKGSGGDEAKVYKPGDVILIETDVLYRQKKPPSVAVIVSMWEVKPVGEDVSGDPDRMRLRVHWFLRPSELAAIRQKREHAENEIYYSLNSTDILAPSVILSHCSVSSLESHIAKPVKKAKGTGARYAEEEEGDEKFYCRHAINAKRGLYYRLNWDKHHASVAPTALVVPDESSPDLNTWGQGTEWDVDTTEEVKPSRPKDGPPPKKRVKRERKEGEEPPSESEDSGSDAEIDSEEEDDDEGLEAIEEEDEEGGEEPDDDEIGNPKTPSRRKRKRAQAAPKTPRKTKKTLAQPTPHSKAAIRKRKRRDDAKTRKKGGFVIRPPTLSFKTDLSHLPKDPWLRAMHVLHVGNRPEALPCRGAEYDKVMQCVGDLLEEGSGGCVYISGVPGTGKTATVHTVVKELKRLAENSELNPFTYVEINGLRIPEPSVAYSLLWEAISQNTNPTQTSSARGVSAKESLKALTQHFHGRNRGPAQHAYVVLMDELDQLVTAKQDVIYNFFNWPTLANSNLVVIAVANTMDLPERVMTGRVRSRLGMTRINFQPYEHGQLQEIVLSRLATANEGLEPDEIQEVLSKDAIKLAAMRISSITGDARRVLDVCRRVVENVSEKRMVGKPAHVTKVLSVMQSSPTAGYLADCSLHERIMLASLIKCVKREGVEEIKWDDVQYQHMNYLGALSGVNESRKPTLAELTMVLESLVASRAVLLEDGAGVARKPEGERRLLLNIEQIEVERVLSDVGGPVWKNVLST